MSDIAQKFPATRRILKGRIHHGPALEAGLTMTYLRLRKFHRAQPGLANTEPNAEPSIEIQPAGEIPGAEEIRPRVAAVTIKHRRVPVERALPEVQGRSEARRTGTLHRPVHAG